MQRSQPYSPRIQWSHPLSAGLWHCTAFPSGPAGAFDLANTGSAALSTTAVAAGTPVGTSAYAAGGNNVLLPNRGNLAAGDFTLHALFRPRSWASDFSVLVEKGTSSSEAGREFGIFFDTSGNVNFTHVGQNTFFATRATGLTTWRVWSLVLTRTGTTLQYYVNGEPAGATFSLNGAGTGAVATNLSLSASTTGSPHGDIDWLLFQFWRGRTLSASEVRLLSSDPFGLLRPKHRIRTLYGGVPAPPPASGRPHLYYHRMRAC
jgi:hypothetical protein